MAKPNLYFCFNFKQSTAYWKVFKHCLSFDFCAEGPDKSNQNSNDSTAIKSEVNSVLGSRGDLGLNEGNDGSNRSTPNIKSEVKEEKEENEDKSKIAKPRGGNDTSDDDEGPSGKEKYTTRIQFSTICCSFP